METSPDMVDGVRVSLALSASKGNAFNSNSDGPWKFIAGFRSKMERRLIVDGITFYNARGGVIHRMDSGQQLEMFPIHGEFRANFQPREKVDLPADAGDLVTIIMRFSVDTERPGSVKAVFRARRVEGWETINLGTM